MRIKAILALLGVLAFESVIGAPSQLSRLPKSGSYSGYTRSAKFGSYTVLGKIKKPRVSFSLQAHGMEAATLVGNLTRYSRRCFTGKISTGSSRVPVKLINCSYDVKNRKLTGILESRGSKRPSIELSEYQTSASKIAAYPPSLLIIANTNNIPTSSGYVNYDAQYQSLSSTSPNLTVESFPITAKYDDLIISNIISGAMLGHLIKTHDASKGVVIDRDRMYTSVLSHLLKEDGGQVAEQYNKDAVDKTIVSAKADVMGAGQGGPYQINDWNNVLYDKGWQSGTQVDPTGLVSFTTLQGFMYPWTVDLQNTQSSPPFEGTPSFLNDKYFAPMVVAYRKYLSMLALEEHSSKNDPLYQLGRCYSQLSSDNVSGFKQGNILDLILTASYNSGAYSIGIESGGDVTPAGAFIALCNSKNNADKKSQYTQEDCPTMEKYNTMTYNSGLTANQKIGCAINNASIQTRVYYRDLGIKDCYGVNIEDGNDLWASKDCPPNSLRGLGSEYPYWIDYARASRITVNQMLGSSLINEYLGSTDPTMTNPDLAFLPTGWSNTASLMVQKSLLRTVFIAAFTKLGYYDVSSKHWNILDATTVGNAFDAAFTDTNITYSYNDAMQRKILFDGLDAAINKIEQSMSTPFGNVSFVQLYAKP